ncbi:aminotransferase class I/II-fold pyridoxal phosphate-dependent enzyme [Staphylococcus haemolyticus]|uniref:DegT/DnrJ/EryC1/StrS family aminotransferase n=1 Tax=Staphylococcus TaxID=1279 RepID=UPI000D1E7EEE|nr:MULTISPECIES: aminotransferase class I/II-fold pyridoxal phosphate-dependent enzyme [Staphylococcus]PTK62954.1 pyridoxal phosphate-dependent aminotransferase [Staphylococcus haemolyticus]PTK70593.1 pyridoxal phosphate-dependent aminotransferase [Staphylococcus haemolyticus]PTK76778.1 pyridoxal phosphate-dependent aminotransferase [Staphylococcus haemolyticus]PTK80193.1 pyridoxal phosphate-dependent aminotransferase [Staphylococcus haemolyticus]PTK87738.1 pyridoxal phosphate-dependent aminot
MEEERIFLSRPHMGGTELDYIHDAFDKNWIAPLGENVTEFENSIKNYVGVNAAVAVGSGTSAIHLALIESGVQKDDIVFCSSLTFSASANPIIYQGAIPVFIDSEMDSWNMSPNALRKAFEKYAEKGIKPKAVVSVNLYGQSAKMDEIKAICDEYKTTLVEDAAESLGAIYKGQKSGTFGNYGIFSFNGNKIITTSGGGMLISNDEEHIAHALFVSTQARDKALHYQHSELGYNYRLSNISAGIGRGQMEVLDQRIQRRREIFDKYNAAFSSIEGFDFQPELPDSKSNRWLTALTIDESKTGFSALDLIDALQQNNIEARPVWKPMHLQPFFESYDYIMSGNDNGAYLFNHGVCLPSGSDMTDAQQDRVIEIIKSL